MSNEQNKMGMVFMALLIIALLAFLIRPMALMILFFGLVAAVVMGMVHLFKMLEAEREKKRKSNSVNGIIEQRIEQCNVQIEANTLEIKEIRANIRDLEFRLNQAIAVNEPTRRETLYVIEGFKKQLSLRETKISFYTTCKKKLSTLLYNYSLAQELVKKKEKLSQLQEENFESIAEMENMKSDMSYDFSFVETISELSSRMIKSSTLDSARELQLQLVEMTTDLKDL